MFQTPIIEQRPTPNKYQGRRGFRPIGVTVHIAQAPSLLSIDNTFRLSGSESSSHYAAGREEMVIHQYVEEEDTAWHTGLLDESKTDPAQRPVWKLWNPTVNPNLVTIGIENVGFSVDITYGKGTRRETSYKATGAFTDWQYYANAWLIARAAKRWGFAINADTVVPHGAIYRRKRDLCPGPAVSMARIISEALELSKSV